MSMALWVMCTDKEWVKENYHLFDSDSIPRGPARWLVEAALKMWMENRSLLTPEVVLSLTEDEGDFALHGTSLEEAIAFYLEVVNSRAKDTDAAGYRQNVAGRWFRQMSLSANIDEVQALSEAGDTEGAIRASRRAERLVAGGGKAGLTFISPAPPPLRPAIRTGFEELDDNWRGGMHQGLIGVVVAPSNQGKSMLLPAMAATALQQGKNVLVYSTELSEGVWLERVMSALLQQPIDTIDDDFETYRQMTFDHLNRMQGMAEDETFFAEHSNGERYFDVRYRDAGTLTTTGIESDLEALRDKGIRIHMVILDGDDIGVANNKKFDKAYDMYYHIYDQLSSLAKKKDIVIWTAAQGKRDSFKRERQRDDDVGDSLWKYRKVDIALGLAQPSDKTGELKKDGEGKPYIVVVITKDRYFSTKNRTFYRQARFGDRTVTEGVCGFKPYVQTLRKHEE
jgi:hypothetical protein